MKSGYPVLIVLLSLVLGISACEKEPEEKDPVTPVDLTHIPYAPTAEDLVIPAGLPAMYQPVDNPLTKEGVLLGRFLFYDPILSKDSTISCASCHRQELAFTDGLARSVGFAGRTGTRSSMSLVNIGFADNGLFWDGRVSSLEEQALHPVEDQNEMAEKWPDVLKKLQRHGGYPEMFRRAFGVRRNIDITKEMVARALAQFQRTLVSGESKYDRVYRQEDFFTDDELDGFLIFMDASNRVLPDGECGHCHNVNLFAVNSYFHNGLVPEEELEVNAGRFAVTGNPNDKGKFRATTLRNIMVTGPYMHDGRLATIDDVLVHYQGGGHHSFNRDPLLADLERTSLSAEHLQKIKVFLNTLTDSTFLRNPAFSNPFQ